MGALTLQTDDLLLIQGTLSLDALGLVLEYSTTRNLTFREAEKNFQSARGIKARELLRIFLDPSSYADIMLLLEMFDKGTIEFATYEVDLGVLPYRNTVIFELRGY